jgi:hypothetical protein
MNVEAAMRRAIIALLGMALFGGLRGLAPAQDLVKQDKSAEGAESKEVTIYYAVVIGDGTIEGSAKVISIGPERRTKAEAEEDEKRWNKEHPTSLRLTDVREKTQKVAAEKLKEAKDAIDQVKDAKDLVDDPLGTLKKKMDPDKGLNDYVKNIEAAYERVKLLRQGLTANTKKITNDVLENVNKQINKYNKDVDQARSGPNGSAFTRFSKISPVTPGELGSRLGGKDPEGQYTVWVYKLESGQWVKQEDRTLATSDADQAAKYLGDVKRVPGWTATSNLPNREPQLAGSTWIVTSSDGQSDRWIFGQTNGLSFQNLSVARDRGTGTWSLSGTALTAHTGFASWQGTVEGDRITGTAANQTQTKRWEWSAARQ